MKIALISDTHDHMDNIKEFVNIFNDNEVDYIFHCGDFVSPFVARVLNKLNENVKFFGVRGNNDGDIIHLNRTFANLGKIQENHVIAEVDGLSILMLHGHAISVEMIDAIAAIAKYDLIFHGHYHEIRDEVVGEKTRVLNPGEACGYLTGKSTAMLIKIGEQKKLEVELLEL